MVKHWTKNPMNMNVPPGRCQQHNWTGPWNHKTNFLGMSTSFSKWANPRVLITHIENCIILSSLSFHLLTSANKSKGNTWRVIWHDKSYGSLEDVCQYFSTSSLPLLSNQMNVTPSLPHQLQHKQKLWVSLNTLCIEILLLRSCISCSQILW